ncbi:MAG: precorrin-2 C(20)-methyltransferase [Zetaproteobacteria bacterium]|nr:precorrin-2 C(20)-methyltransferase [Pseudobdellovibrionaceae bacterium]
MSWGQLYGVGVGPGAPDLLTVRAVRVLNDVDVIAIPRPNKWSKSLAWRIAEPNVEKNDEQEHLFLEFPMTKDKSVLGPAWDKAFAAIGQRLAQGKSVAFITQGDPMVYSTFIYLFSAANKLWPEVPVKIIPGVTSISAVPAAARVPLADGMERVAVLPATYGVDDLRQVLNDFDTIVLMKVSSVIQDVVGLLEEEGLLDKAVYVEKASSSEERVIRDVRQIRHDKCVYFSMIVVAKKERAGILSDDAESLQKLEKYWQSGVDEGEGNHAH